MKTGLEGADLLALTYFLDHDDPAVASFAEAASSGAADEAEAAARLFLAVRDGIMYDPYGIDLSRESFRASACLKRGRGYCVNKAVLLAASARRIGIPASLGFADVYNHLNTPRLKQAMGTDLFAWHGFAEMRIKGRVLKASPAFNARLCERFGVPAVEFDGLSDALLQPLDGSGRKYMEYGRDRGSFADLPFEELAADMKSMYPFLLGGKIRGDFAAEAARERQSGDLASGGRENDLAGKAK